MTPESTPRCACDCGAPAIPGPRFAGEDHRAREAHRARFNRRLTAKRAHEAGRLGQDATVLRELGLSEEALPSRLAAELEDLSDRTRRLAILVGARLELSDDATRVRREADQAQQVAATERAMQDLIQVHQKARQHAERELASIQSALGGAQDQLAETTGDLAEATSSELALKARLQTLQETDQRSQQEAASAARARQEADEATEQAVRERAQAQRERENARVSAVAAEAQASQTSQALLDQREAHADVRAALTAERDRLIQELAREREQAAVEKTAAQVLAEQRLTEQSQAAAKLQGALTGERDRLVAELSRGRSLQ